MGSISQSQAGYFVQRGFPLGEGFWLRMISASATGMPFARMIGDGISPAVDGKFYLPAVSEEVRKPIERKVTHTDHPLSQAL